MLRKSSLENACGTTYVQNHYFEGKCSGNHYCKMHFDTKYVQNHYSKGKCSGNHYLKMHLTPNMYKIVT